MLQTGTGATETIRKPRWRAVACANEKNFWKACPHRHSRSCPKAGQGTRGIEPALLFSVLLFRSAIIMDFLTIFPAPACFRRVLIGFAAALALFLSLAIAPRGLSAPQKIKPPAEAEAS